MEEKRGMKLGKIQQSQQRTNYRIIKMRTNEGNTDLHNSFEALLYILKKTKAAQTFSISVNWKNIFYEISDNSQSQESMQEENSKSPFNLLFIDATERLKEWIEQSHEIREIKELEHTLIPLLNLAPTDHWVSLRYSTLATFIAQQVTHPLVVALVESPLSVKVEFEEQSAQTQNLYWSLSIQHILYTLNREQLPLSIFDKLLRCFSLNMKRITQVIKGIALCPYQSSLSQRKKSEETIQILIGLPGFKLNLDVLELLINTDFFSIAYKLASSRLPKLRALLQSEYKESEQFWDALGKSFESGMFLQIKIWLVKQFILLATTEFVRAVTEAKPPLSLSRNPIKTAILFHQMLQSLKVHFSLQQQSIEVEQERLMTLTFDFMDTIDSRDQIHKILQEKDIEGRPVYFLMKKHPLLLFKIDTIIQHQWEGAIPLYRRESLFLSTMARIFWQKTSSPFGSCRQICRRLKGEQLSPFQLQLARRSPLLKFSTHFMIIFAIGLFMQISVVTSIQRTAIVFQENDVANPSQEAVQAASSIIFFNFMFLVVLQPLTVLFIISTILDKVFSRLAGRPLSLINLDFLLNIVLLFLDLLIYYNYAYELASTNIQSELQAFHKLRNVPYPPNMDVYYGLFAAAIWLKLINFFHATRTVGPLLKIITRMSRDIFNFLSLGLLVLLLFSCVGMILFSLPNFVTFDASLKTLYGWMLGDFTFDDVAEQGLKGSLFLALYLLISLVLLLNLLIAVLSSTFSQLESHGVGLYLQSLIDEFPRYSYHPTLNFLTFHSPPFNILSLIFLPCAKKPNSKCATVLEVIYYFPLYLVVLAGVLITDIIAFPFAYYSYLTSLFLKRKPLQLILAIFYFPLCLPLVLILDLAITSIQLWKYPSRTLSQKHHKYVQTKHQGLLYKDLEILVKLSCDDYQRMQDPVPVSEVVRKIRDVLPFTCNYSDFAAIVTSVYPDAFTGIPLKLSKRYSNSSSQSHFSSTYISHFLSPPSRDELQITQNAEDALQRFDSIKQFLGNNSFTDSKDQVYFYPGLLLLTIMESMAMHKLEELKQVHRRSLKSRTKQVYTSKKEEEFQNINWLVGLRSGRFIQKENERRLAQVDLKEVIFEMIERREGKRPWVDKSAVREKRMVQQRLRARQLIRKHFPGMNKMIEEN